MESTDEMARGAGEPSAKRAKVDETEEEEDALVRRREEVIRLLEEASAKGKDNARAKKELSTLCARLREEIEGLKLRIAKLEAEEEEDALVRRREEVIRLLEEASAKGKDNARAKKELSTLCAKLEAKNEKSFGGCRLPPDLWSKILDENLHPNDLPALAMTCRSFRVMQKDFGWKMETNLKENRLLNLRKSGKVASHSLGWYRWVCDTFDILPGYEWGERFFEGEVEEGDLVNYAAFQGSVEILRWLIEEKGWELNVDTGEWAGWGGNVKVLENLGGRGYEFDENACYGAGKGGHWKALKFLRGLDPPCPWDVRTCLGAASGGHLDALKWLRSQDPPCPWNERTCSRAAGRGHLEVLQWARDQDPPCPWNETTCYEAAKGGHLEVLKWARSQDPPCPWNEWTCSWAAEEGRLEVLKWLRSQDPPCPWNERTCREAAREGHLDILKWARDQDPPCPWGERTCAHAAGYGHLEVLMWARGQDPPCPWSRRKCRGEAWEYGHEHIVEWIDQQEDESDVSDSDR